MAKVRRRLASSHDSGAYAAVVRVGSGDGSFLLYIQE